MNKWAKKQEKIKLSFNTPIGRKDNTGAADSGAGGSAADPASGPGGSVSAAEGRSEGGESAWNCEPGLQLFYGWKRTEIFCGPIIFAAFFLSNHVELPWDVQEKVLFDSLYSVVQSTVLFPPLKSPLGSPSHSFTTPKTSHHPQRNEKRNRVFGAPQP